MKTLSLTTRGRQSARILAGSIAASSSVSCVSSEVRTRLRNFQRALFRPDRGRATQACLALGVLWALAALPGAAEAATFTATYDFGNEGSGTFVGGNGFLSWDLGSLDAGSILKQVDIVLRLDDNIDGGTWISDLNFMVGGNALIGYSGILGLNGGDTGDTGVTATDTKYESDWIGSDFGEIDLHTSALGFFNDWGDAVWSGTFTITYESAGAFVGLTWKGGDGTAPMEWSTSGSVTGNWNDGASDVAYANGQNVLFDDSVGGGATTIDLSVADVTPQSVVFNNTGANTYTLTGSKAIAGSATLTKQGDGVVILENANTYSGKTTISAGTLRIGNTEALPHGSGKNTVKIDVDGTLDLNGLSPTLNGITGTGTVTSGVAGAATLTVGDADTSFTFAGVIEDGSGTVGLTKIGGGTLTLTGSGSSYTGKTSVLSGTLYVGVAWSNAGVNGPLGAPTGANAVIDLYNDVTLRLGDTNPRTNYSTDRTINLASTGAGTVTVRVNDNDTSFTFGAVTATGTGAKTLDLYMGANGNGDREAVTFNGAISDVSDSSPLSLNVTFRTQSDSYNYLNLPAVNTFTGPITLVKGDSVNFAYLTVGGVGASAGGNSYGFTSGSGKLGNGNYAGAISLDTNTLFNYASSAAQTLSGVLSGAGTLIVSGPGTLTLSGANTYAGGTALDGGALHIGDGGSTGSLGTGAVSLASGTTLSFNRSDTALVVSLGISGAGGVAQMGSGMTTVSGTKTYTGPTTVSNGVLRVNSFSGVPGGSAVVLNGGVLGLGVADFTRTLGTGTTQAQFTGDGGFAAFTSDRAVNFGGGGSMVTWGAGSFVPDGNKLIFGSATADAMLDFQNAIDLGATDRTVQVEDGISAMDTDATLSGAITSSGGGLIKTGAGTLNLDAAQGYDALTASAGTTNVNGVLGTDPVTGSANVTVSDNAKLRFGTVSQTLSSLTIGAGATVTFTGETAMGAFSGGKALSFGGAAMVPEPGTLGLLLVGTLGVLGRRRRVG